MGQKIFYNLNDIAPIISGKKFLLVRGKSYEYLDIKAFFDNYRHAEFSAFTPNPLYEQVCDGVNHYNKEKCELIVAAGGGSAIDVAKCIKLYCKMDSSKNYLEQNMFDSGIALIAVPTTAGTGSESTRHAVIYYEGIKQSISHESIIPNYAVLIPSVLKTLPDYQKKSTMLDALCHAVESWWSVNSTDESKVYSKKAISAIKANYEEYIFQNNERAASEIMAAANSAGHAISITATTAAHAMSYKLSSMYHLSHGHAAAVCLKEVWEYMLGHTKDCIDKRGEEYLKNTLNQIADVIDLDYFKSILKKLEISYPTSADRERELEILSQSVNPIRLKNNPVRLSAETLKGLYERILYD